MTNAIPYMIQDRNIILVIDVLPIIFIQSKWSKGSATTIINNVKIQICAR